MKSIDIPPDRNRGNSYVAGMEMVTRLTMVIRSAQLDCECRLKLDETVARFARLERKRTTRRHLLEARERREQIEVILSFLGDLDGLKSTERDHSIYVDIALLFDHVAEVAREGADAMRQLYATVEDGGREVGLVAAIGRPRSCGNAYPAQGRVCFRRIAVRDRRIRRRRSCPVRQGRLRARTPVAVSAGKAG